HAEFFPSETTEGCLKVMKTYIKKKGLFKTLYVDRAGIFGGPKRCHFSQMQRACEELGIEIIFANSPQGKGRIERAFDTFQDRLVPELRLA
ncbi:transposase family protein, partial [Vibrio sp. F13]